MVVTQKINTIHMSRNYCFTAFTTPAPTMDLVIYMVYGEEKCPDTGRLHYQGYVEFTKTQRVAGAKKIFKDDSLHFEKRRGTQKQAIDYCKKDGRFVEFGVPTKQGKRNDLEAIVQECKTIDEVMDKHPQVYCMYRNGLKDIYSKKVEENLPVVRNVKVEVYWGVTGSGKTYKALTENDDVYRLLYSQKSDRVNFDGYRGQKCLLIDEFYGQIDYAFMLCLLDKYKLQLHVKGSTTWAQWEKVIITSNSSPCLWYPDQQNIDPLLRRITTTIHFTEAYVTPVVSMAALPPRQPVIDPLMIGDDPLRGLALGGNEQLRSPPNKRLKTDMSVDMENFVLDVSVSDDDN